MKWILIVTALVNGHVYNADKTTYKTKEACLQVLKKAEQHPMFKAYHAKASCEKAP